MIPTDAIPTFTLQSSLGVTGQLLPEKTVRVSKNLLIPVSKFSKYDSALLCANEQFIIYATSKPGTLRVISQTDAVHVVLDEGEGDRLISLNLAEHSNGTSLAAFFENGQCVIWNLESKETQGVDSSLKANLTCKYQFPKSFRPNFLKSFPDFPYFLVGSNESIFLILKNSQNDGNPSRPRFYTELTSMSCNMKAVDVAFSHDGLLFVLHSSGSIYVWKADISADDNPSSALLGSLQLNIDQATSIIIVNDRHNNPLIIVGSIATGVLRVLDVKIGDHLNYTITQNVVFNGIKSRSGDTFIIQYHERSRIIIIVEISNNIVLFLHLDKNGQLNTSRSLGYISSASCLQLDDSLEILDFAVTSSLDEKTGINCDIYIFHKTGLSILSVQNSDLDRSNSELIQQPEERILSGSISVKEEESNLSDSNKGVVNIENQPNDELSEKLLTVLKSFRDANSDSPFCGSVVDAVQQLFIKYNLLNVIYETTYNRVISELLKPHGLDSTALESPLFYREASNNSDTALDDGIGLEMISSISAKNFSEALSILIRNRERIWLFNNLAHLSVFEIISQNIDPLILLSAMVAIALGLRISDNISLRISWITELLKETRLVSLMRTIFISLMSNLQKNHDPDVFIGVMRRLELELLRTQPLSEEDKHSLLILRSLVAKSY